MAQKRIDRKLDLAVGAVTFTNLENGEATTHSVDSIFGKGSWDLLKGLKNGEMAQRAMLHSVNAFGGDAAADKTIDAIVAINARVQSVVEGNWTMKGSGSGGGGTRVTIIDRAVAMVKEISVEDAVAAINAAAEKKGVEAKDVRKGLGKNPKIAAAVAKIRADQMRTKAKAASKEAEGTADDFEL
jgi:hypothetical protein